MNDSFNELTSIDPAEIEPLHDVRNHALFDELMWQEGRC
jgi:hypothetical protein